MSEHAWTLEHIAAHVAGGLDAAEGERLDAHAADCPECIAALNEARALDRGLDGLFADRRPGAGLEDRMIQSLRMEAARTMALSRWRRKVAWGAAAAVVLGAAGAGIAQIGDGGGLPFPGAPSGRRSYDAKGAEQVQGAFQAPPRKGYEVLGSDGGDELAQGKSHYAQSFSAAGIDARMYDGSVRLVPGQPLDPEAMAQAIRESAGKTISDGTSNTIAYAEDYKKESPTNLARKITPGSGFAGGGVGGISPPSAASPDRRQVPSGRSTQASEMVRSADLEPAVPRDAYLKPTEFDKRKSEPSVPADGEGKNKEEREKERKPPPDQVPAKEKPPDKTAAPKPDVPAAEPAPTRKVIRSGDIEFEVESFDSALATVTKLVIGIKGAFVGTVNSDKLANGKVKGSIVVRVPPDSLDTLVLDLRKELGKGGELKGQRIASVEVTKHYTDLEGRLKAARTMEQRLLQIIKEGKGEIKQLLEAEKELGNWREKIEHVEGEIRFYASQVALSTLTITLAEKDVRAAADVVESERVQAGLEVEDVDKTMREVLAAVAEAKGRVTKSELKQVSVGQYNAALQFEVAPEAAGPLRDRLKQLGTMVRLDIDRVQRAEGGTAPAPRDAKVKRGDTAFDLSLYNLAKIQPRETATVQVAVADVPAAYRALREAVEKAKGRVVGAELNEQDRQNVTAQLDFDVRRSEEGAIQQALTAAGDTVSRSVNRAPESQGVTDAKVLFKTSLVSAAHIRPRETVTLGIEVADVDAARAVFAAQVAEVHGRSINEQVAHERNGRVTGLLVYDVPFTAASSLVEKFKGSGTVRVQSTARNLQAPEGNLALARIDVTVSNADLIVPKDDGLWPQVRTGLSYSLLVLSKSVSWLIFGICVLGPWALIAYGVYRLVRRLFGTPAAVPVAPVVVPPAAS